MTKSRKPRNMFNLYKPEGRRRVFVYSYVVHMASAGMRPKDIADNLTKLGYFRPVKGEPFTSSNISLILNWCLANSFEVNKEVLQAGLSSKLSASVKSAPVAPSVVASPPVVTAPIPQPQAPSVTTKQNNQALASLVLDSETLTKEQKIEMLRVLL